MSVSGWGFDFFNEVILTFLRQKSKVTVLKIINEIRKRWKLSLRTKLKISKLAAEIFSENHLFSCHPKHQWTLPGKEILLPYPCSSNTTQFLSHFSMRLLGQVILIIWRLSQPRYLVSYQIIKNTSFICIKC